MLKCFVRKYILWDMLDGEREIGLLDKESMDLKRFLSSQNIVTVTTYL